MKKVIAIIPITILFILLFPHIDTLAAGPFTSYAGFFQQVSEDQYYYYGIIDEMDNPTCYYDPDPLNRPGVIRVTSNNINVPTYRFYFDIGSGQQSVGSMSEWMQAISESKLLTSGTTNFNQYYSTPILTNGITFIGNNNYNDPNVNPLPDPEPDPQPTWYEQLFQDFLDAAGAAITGGVEGFLDWLSEAWTVPVGEGEDELAIELITPIPTPTPTPMPTPIPYQTQLTPDGNGGFNITYIYVNPSGTPTSAPMPPTNPPSGSDPVDDDDFEYPYYNNPVNSDDPYELDIPWYLKFKFKGVTTSLNDFQTGIDETVDMVNDNQENIDIVMDSVGLFPSDWLLIFGFIGSIPLVGGIISRLLKG